MPDQRIMVGEDRGSVMTLTLTVSDYTTPVEVEALRVAVGEHQGELRGMILRIESAAMVRRAAVY